LSVEGRSRRAGLHDLFVKEDQAKALLSIGSYLLQGTVDLPAGSELQDSLTEQESILARYRGDADR